MVLVGRTRVKHMRVSQELNVTDLEDHVEREFHAGIFEDLDSLVLSGREGWDDSRVGEAGERADVIGVPSERFVSIGISSWCW